MNIYIPTKGSFTTVKEFMIANEGKLPSNFESIMFELAWGDSAYFNTDKGGLFRVVRLG